MADWVVQGELHRGGGGKSEELCIVVPSYAGINAGLCKPSDLCMDDTGTPKEYTPLILCISIY